MRLHWQQKSSRRVSRLVAFSDPVVRVTMRVSIRAVYFGALYVMEAQGSLTPRRHGRSVRGTTTSVPHAPRAPLFLTLTLTLSLALALTLALTLTLTLSLTLSRSARALLGRRRELPRADAGGAGKRRK